MRPRWASMCWQVSAKPRVCTYLLPGFVCVLGSDVLSCARAQGTPVSTLGPDSALIGVLASPVYMRVCCCRCACVCVTPLSTSIAEALSRCSLLRGWVGPSREHPELLHGLGVVLTLGLQRKQAPLWAVMGVSVHPVFVGRWTRRGLGSYCVTSCCGPLLLACLLLCAAWCGHTAAAVTRCGHS